MKEKHMQKTFQNGSSATANLVQLSRVHKIYKTAAGEFTALQSIDLQIAIGEFIAIVGKSGSGKSTLLNMLTGIDRATSGEIVVNHQNLPNLSEDQMASWRGRNVGIVFQFFQLLPTLTVIENVMLAMDFCNVIPSRERRRRALALLTQVGVAEQAHKLPSMLSGGQQQRVAIARALANDPPILVADEPTGNLDSQTADAILQLFTQLVAQGKTVIVVTHERDISDWVSRTVTLADGNIVADTRTPLDNFLNTPAEVVHAQ